MSKCKCEDCGSLEDVMRGAGDRWLCERCDSDYVDCDVCGETHDADSACRHVYWTPGAGWCGSGSVENDADVARADFRALLPRLDAVPGLVADIRYHAGGNNRIVSLDDEFGILPASRRSEFVPDGCTPEDESIRAGWDWLASLDGDATAHANAATALWIEEWLRKEEAADADA